MIRNTKIGLIVLPLTQIRLSCLFVCLFVCLFIFFRREIVSKLKKKFIRQDCRNWDEILRVILESIILEDSDCYYSEIFYD